MPCFFCYPSAWLRILSVTPSDGLSVLYLSRFASAEPDRSLSLDFWTIKNFHKELYCRADKMSTGLLYGCHMDPPPANSASGMLAPGAPTSRYSNSPGRLFQIATHQTVTYFPRRTSGYLITRIGAEDIIEPTLIVPRCTEQSITCPSTCAIKGSGHSIALVQRTYTQ
jgi:hypothetical protein